MKSLTSMAKSNPWISVFFWETTLSHRRTIRICVPNLEETFGLGLSEQIISSFLSFSSPYWAHTDFVSFVFRPLGLTTSSHQCFKTLSLKRAQLIRNPLSTTNEEKKKIYTTTKQHAFHTFRLLTLDKHSCWTFKPLRWANQIYEAQYSSVPSLPKIQVCNDICEVVLIQYL